MGPRDIPSKEEENMKTVISTLADITKLEQLALKKGVDIKEIQEELKSKLKEEQEKNYLGYPVVTIQTLLGNKKERAIAKSSDNEIYIGIHPDIQNTIKNGNKVVYVDPFAVKILDTVKYLSDSDKEKLPSFDDIGGLDEQITEIKVVLDVYKNEKSELAKKLGIRPTRGILLYGPTGTGKTMIGKACAKAIDGKFIYIDTPDLFSKWYGETAQNIKGIFESARNNGKYTIIFFDEITSLCGDRNYSTTTASTDKEDYKSTDSLLAQMGGLLQNGDGNEKILVIGSTNRPFSFDNAVAGRFEKHIEIPSPDHEAKLEIFKKLIKGKKTPTKNVVPNNVITLIEDQKENASGRDIEAIINEAGLVAFESGREDVNFSDFKKGIERYSRRVDVDIRRYQNTAQGGYTK